MGSGVLPSGLIAGIDTVYSAALHPQPALLRSTVKEKAWPSSLGFQNTSGLNAEGQFGPFAM